MRNPMEIGAFDPTMIFGEHEQRVIDQLDRCVAQEEGSLGVLCADGHLGYSAPIGGVVAYREHVSPAAVGYDIGCGNMAVKIDLQREYLADYLPDLMDRIFSEVSFGMGRRDGKAADHPVVDKIREADFEPQRALADEAGKQLGTVGAGNHYVDLFADEDDQVWIGVHFGSRGFGHKTASGFLAMAKGKPFTERVGEGEMEAPPDVLRVGTEVGDSYLAAMKLAGEYAYAGREVVVQQVLDILGAEALDAVHNHHNFAWKEQHGGEDFYVVRKGATPAFPGQRGFVGATMGEPAVILEGVESELSAKALHSTVHGAGRTMSRTKAAGKMGNVFVCTERDCEFGVSAKQYRRAREDRGIAQHDRFTLCPAHPEGRMQKVRRRIKGGAIDWPTVQAELAAEGIELRGAAADEAPGAYKRLPEVLAAHEGTVRVLHTLRPLGVAMAPDKTYDPYKD